ncbi:MAG: hypothetical protein ABFD46_09245 [Armatimonadota bacterium]
MKQTTGIVVFVILLIAFSVYIPFRVDTCYKCPYCRAALHEKRMLFFSSSIVAETTMSKYWKASVDPKHKHIWKSYVRNEYMLLGSRHGDGTDWPGCMLDEKAEIAVLKSLHTPRERKALIDRLWITSNSSRAGYEKSKWILQSLDVAYKENLNRKDWKKILKNNALVP